jgi:hypothetical protein
MMKKVVDEQRLKASKKPKNEQLFARVMQRLQVTKEAVIRPLS